MSIASKKVVFTVAALAVLGVGVYAAYGLTRERNPDIAYRFAKVERGTVTRLVSASGKLTSVVTVLVGSQVSGQIRDLYVDFNSPVKAGQVIARIGPESFEAKVLQARADLAVAEATVLTKKAALERARAESSSADAALAGAGADVVKAKANLADLESDFKRKTTLRKQGFVAQSALDKARAAFDSARAELDAARSRLSSQHAAIDARKAEVEMASAEVSQSQADVEKQRATLRLAEVDLEHTVIRSPVDGIVINRSVDVGQTVAASLQAPTLFTIAQDLRRMRVETSIDEADIGQVAVGQSAQFEVDAFPGERFAGRVAQIRKQAVETENVVTYTVVITADNPDLRLLPGMTAQVQILVARLENVLRVANAALRFRPPGVAARPTSTGAGNDDVAAERRARDRGKREARRLDRMTKELKLTKAQRDQIAELYQGLRKRTDTMREGGMDGNARREATRKLRADLEREVAAVLTPEQRATYERAAARRQARTRGQRGQVWVLRDGTPVAVGLRVGASDGAFTAILGGRLNEGDEIITGMRPGAASGRGSIRSGLFRGIRF